MKEKFFYYIDDRDPAYPEIKRTTDPEYPRTLYPTFKEAKEAAIDQFSYLRDHYAEIVRDFRSLTIRDIKRKEKR